MSDEAQSKIILALGDVVDSLTKEAERQQRCVQGMLENGSKGINAVSLAAKEHQDLAKELPIQVKTAIASALDGAASKAAGVLTSKFKEADEQAQLAARRYENAAKITHWKTIFILVCTWVATVAIAVLMIWYTSTENQSLRRDRGTLKTILTHLEKSPEIVQISLCGAQKNLLCVYVQTEKGKWEPRLLANLNSN